MRLRFEDQVLDIARRELRRADALVPLEPQVFDLLAYVIRNRDRVVSKDDLVEAVWRGRAISDSTLTTRINAMRKALGDSGEDQRLIRTIARRGIRFVGEVTEDEPPSDAEIAARPADHVPLPLPDRPSIAVLPFQNMSGDPEQDYFCDGVVEEITTALSRFRALFVISRNAAFTYKGLAIDVKRVARDLGVRYVLEGSVRKAGARVRIAGQLIDSDSGAHLWADRFDGDLADLFELQDRIAVGIVGAIAPKIEAAEIERVRRKPVANLDAYDLCLQAQFRLYAMTRESTREAITLLERAIRLQPDYALAMARAASCFNWRDNHGWLDNAAAEGQRAIDLARTALALDRDDPEVLTPTASTINRFARDLVEAKVLIERALSLNPNFAEAWAHSGYLRLYSDEAVIALQHFEEALRISPLGPMRHLVLGGIGMAKFYLGDLESAADTLDRATREHRNNVSNYRFFASVLAYLGRQDEAERAARIASEVDPSSTISSLRRRIRHHPSFAAIYLDGLRKAGYPE